MGCSNSKAEDIQLVSICRERRDLIRAAADHRYALSAAHSAYFDSLRAIGHAIHRFLTEEISISSSVLPSSTPPPPVVTLPSSSSSSQDNNNKSPLPPSSSVSLAHESPPSEDSHMHFHSDSGDGDGNISVGGSPRLSSAAQLRTNHYHMKSSTAIPSVIFRQKQDLHSSHTIEVAPIDSTSLDPHSSDRPARPPTPPPPPPDVSGWDFLNPFHSFDNFYPRHSSCPPEKLGYSSIAGSPDWAQVREREGIPDLEDEMAEQLPAKEVKNKEEEMNAKELDNFGVGSSEGISKPATSQNGRGVVNLPRKKRTKNKPHRRGSGSKSAANLASDKNMRKKAVASFGVETAVADSIKSSQRSQLDPTSTNGNAESIESLKLNKVSGTHHASGMREVVKEIKDQFETAFNYGKEVSELLEAGKLQYQPLENPTAQVFSCRVLDAIDPPKFISLWSSSKPLHHTAEYCLANARDRVPSMKSGSLSLTLEKLYAWEKKLYKEVKDEEKLRVIYEKKCKKLRLLDDRGKETDKIDTIQASIRKLLTKIDITIKAIDTISSRIHKLRDEELQPQLTELIQGMRRMWKNMVKCHQKQFQAILETKNHKYIGKTGIRRDFSMQAAKVLEQELRKWYINFNNWISTQRAYVEALNEWLLKCLLQEPEETPDGMVPFSPSRVGAPPVFIICNDWYHAMERISEYEVLSAMHTFSGRVQMLLELQDEEQRQKLKAEFISKDLERRLKSMRQERRLQRNTKELDKKALVVSNKNSIVLQDDEHRIALDSMKKRLYEERVKHEETLKKMNEAAAGSLEMGLIPIFEAMDDFTSETLKAHEEVRIPSSGGTH